MKLWRDYNLSIVLAALFLVSWAVQLWAQWTSGDDAWQMLAATMENWQSEFLQLLTFVVLTSFLIHRGSHESKDGQEEFQAEALERLERIEEMLADWPEEDGE